MSLSRIRRLVKARRLSALAGGLLVCALASAPSAFATSTPTVDLGQAAGYAVISGATVTNSGDSTVRGDIGASAQPSGFPPGVLVGNFQVGSADATAYNDMQTAYTEVQSRTGGTALPALAGATLTPGLYTAAAAVAVPASGIVTLDAGGDPNGVFVIQVNGAMSLAAGAQVNLTGGAQASNVFWAVNGAFSVAAGAQFEGTALATTTGTILQRPAHGHGHRRRHGRYQRFHPDDQRDHQCRHVGGGHGDHRRADAHRPGSVRRNVVGDSDDSRQRHLSGLGFDC
jgi:hypothetical protein